MMNHPSMGNKQHKGASLLQVALAILVLTISGVFSYNQYLEVTESGQNSAAFEEVLTWLGVMMEMSALYGHQHSGLSELNVIDYAAIKDTTSVFGGGISTTVVTFPPPLRGWELQYPFPTASGCEYVLSRLESSPLQGIREGSLACNSNVLSATVI